MNTAKPRNASWYDPRVSYIHAATRGLMKTAALLIGSMSPARREKFSLPKTWALSTVIRVPRVPKATPKMVANTITCVSDSAKARIVTEIPWKINATAVTFRGPSQSPRKPPITRPTRCNPQGIGQYAGCRQLIQAYVNQRRYLVDLERAPRRYSGRSGTGPGTRRLRSRRDWPTSDDFLSGIRS